MLLGRALVGADDEDADEDAAADVLRHASEIEDYLVAEVLDAQTARVRNFLLVTSTLDTLCPEEVEGLLGPRARRTLHEVVHGNAFVEPVPGRPHCYRYPPFFRDALVAQRAYEATPVLRAVVGEQTSADGGSVLVERLTPREQEVLVDLDELLTTEEDGRHDVRVGEHRADPRAQRARKLGVDRRNAAVPGWAARSG